MGDLLNEIAIGIIVAWLWLLMSFLWRRATKAVTERILMKTCEECQGSGVISCPTCKGVGKSTIKIAETGPCKRCKGTGQIKEVCSECLGKGEREKTLKYKVEEHKTWVHGLLWHQQRISITVRNVDDKAGYFVVSGIIMKDGESVPSEERKVFLKAGDKETINIDFPRGWSLIRPAPHDASFDIKPEVVSFRCGSCQGDGYLVKICPVCRGTRTITETKDITEICSTCEGEKQITCPTCDGAGKVRRFKL